MEELASCLLGWSWSCRFAPANECYRMWTNVKTKWWQPKIMRNKLFLPWIRKQVRAFPSFLLGSLRNALHSVLFSTHIYLFYTYIHISWQTLPSFVFNQFFSFWCRSEFCCRCQYYFSIHDMLQSNKIDKV